MDRQAYLKEIDRCIEKGKFKDSWDSLSQWELPKWYRDAKFGIFIHWGLYSIPAFENEWYSRNMYVQGSKEYEHHMKTYGKHSEFGYKDFIPMFSAEKFDPAEWADLFVKAGAKYVVPVAEHHDGFQMYQSGFSHFNAKEMGPKRDILGELSKEFQNRGIKTCASSHRAEHWFFMGRGKEFDSDVKEPLVCGDFYWPSKKDPDDMFDIYAEPAPDKEFLEDWLVRTCEIVDSYHPELMYFDWWIIHQSFRPYFRKFAAYYYNRAEEWGGEAVINYKHDAVMFGCGVVEIERGQFAQAKPFFWQTDTSVARNSWCYTKNNQYKSAGEILRNLLDAVSKNGAMLLNIGPKADGSIPEEDKKILLEIGEWLAVNGEAVYNSKVWKYAEEGGTKTKEGQFTDGKETKFTGEDIRFTVNGACLYAAVLNYPENQEVLIKELAFTKNAGTPHFHGIIKSVDVLGFEEKPVYERRAEGLRIQTENVRSGKPVVFRIEID